MNGCARSGETASPVSDGWLAIGFSAVILLLVIGGLVSLYALRQSSSEMMLSLNAIGKTREVQFHFQQQFHYWKDVVSANPRSEEFRDSLYHFSYEADRVQDLLFNLKVLCLGFPDLPVRVEALRKRHQIQTDEYSMLSSDMMDAATNTRSAMMAISTSRERDLLASMDDLAKAIEDSAVDETQYVAQRYITRAAAALGIIIALALMMSLYSANRLRQTHGMLDDLVRLRTSDLEQANVMLKREIDEHLQTLDTLERTRGEMQRTNELLSLSEEKYRLIVEGSSDIIFSLDNRFRFIMANKAVLAHFNIGPDELLGREFTEIVWDGNCANSLNRESLRIKLVEMQVSRKPLAFNAEFKSPHLLESKVMQVGLECIEKEGGNEILGKASSVTEDTLASLLETERQKYRIANSLMVAQDLSFRITRNLMRHFSHAEVKHLRMALLELIINAVEHGNLGITFEEKSKAIEQNRYYDFIIERQQADQCSRKRVEIEYVLEPERVLYLIADEGDGFDHADAARSIDQLNDSMETHGRGILLARSIFDSITYNEKGNRVLAIKYLPGMLPRYLSMPTNLMPRSG